VAQDPTTRFEVGHQHAEFGWTRFGRACPGDGKMAFPIGVLGDVHVEQVASLAGLDTQFIDATLPSVRERDGRVVGQANDVTPAQRVTLARPIAVAKAAVGQEGDPPSALEEGGDVFKHRIAAIERDVALGGHNFPRKRQGAIAMRDWHTDTYEKQSGRWQVVWSQATQIR
jgi:hypothetical protein